MMKRLLVILAIGVAFVEAQAQDRLAVVLERAAAASDAQRQSLPSFECREDVVSQHIRKGKVEEEGRMSAQLRVHRGAEGRLDEEIVSDTGRGALPSFVTGGFGMALGYVSREHQACYSYALEGDRLTFHARPHGEVPQCSNPDGVTGWAKVDAAGDITYIERVVPERQAEKFDFVPWAGINLGVVTLDGKEFRMSTAMEAISSNRGDHGRFAASYANCRLFGATVTIHEGAPVEGNSPQ